MNPETTDFGGAMDQRTVLKGATEAESVSPPDDSGTAADEVLTLGFGGVLVAGLFGLPFSEMRRRDRA